MSEKKILENRETAYFLLQDLIDNIEEHCKDAHLLTVENTDKGVCFEIARNFGEGSVYLCIVFSGVGYATVNLYNDGSHTFHIDLEDISYILDSLEEQGLLL